MNKNVERCNCFLMSVFSRIFNENETSLVYARRKLETANAKAEKKNGRLL